MPARTRQCPLCGSRGKKDKEDVIPRWLIAHMDSLGVGKAPKVILWVCNPCNARLNTNFEHPARDIIKAMVAGKAVGLDTEQQVIVGAWLAKTSLLMALKDAEYPTLGPLPRADRRLHAQRMVKDVIATKKPPIESLLLVGLFDEQLPINATPPEDRTYIPSTLPRLNFTGEFNFGRLYYQLYIGKQARLLALAKDLQRASDRLIPIWPQGLDEVEWPPPKPFGIWDRAASAAAWSTQSPPAVFGLPGKPKHNESHDARPSDGTAE